MSGSLPRVALVRNNGRQMADIVAKLKGGRAKEVRGSAEALALCGRFIPRLSPGGSDARAALTQFKARGACHRSHRAKKRAVLSS